MRILSVIAATALLAASVTVASPATPYATAIAQAPRRYALLIGINSYPRKPLEGPVHDVQALATVLRDHYRFDTVDTLLDGQASRAAILKALDALEGRTAAGDLVLVYFSGHGTSALDRRLRLPGLSSNTGALLPADFATGAASDRDLLNHVIIGNRDLRPRFERLETSRDLVVIFDSCYAANTARSMWVDDGNSSRGMDWDDLLEGASTRSGGEALFPDDNQRSPWGAKTATIEPYPYKRTIYLAASGVGEEAQDIPARKLARHPTVDNRPHGAFTNALLKGLAGHANTNGDDILTYRELFEFARRDVSERFPHTPQVSAPVGGEALLDRPVFGSNGVVRPASTAAATGPLRVLVKPGLSSELAAALHKVPGSTVIAAGAHDLRVQPRPGGGALLLHGSGDQLFEYQGAPTSVAEQVLTRVRRQAGLHPLLRMEFPSQTFNISLQLPAPRGFLVVGDKSTLRIDSEVPAFLVILNIDVEGKVAVLYPRTSDELKHATNGLSLDVLADPRYPTGTEFVKVFAYEQRPPGLEAYATVENALDGDSPQLAALTRILGAAPGRRAQAGLKVVTAQAN